MNILEENQGKDFGQRKVGQMMILVLKGVEVIVAEVKVHGELFSIYVSPNGRPN